MSASIRTVGTPLSTYTLSPGVDDTLSVHTTYSTPNTTLPFDSDTPESLFGSTSPTENLLECVEEQPKTVDPARLKFPMKGESTLSLDGPRPPKRKKLSSLND